MTKKTILCLFLTACSLMAAAQSGGSVSSYSRFGLGNPEQQSQGFNRSMGGVAQGLQDGQKLNMLNPASYAAIDSLTFLFDVGMSLGYGHLTDGHQSINARNASLSYVNAGFRIRKGLGMSLGFVPYSSIGYSFTKQNRVGSSFTSAQSIYQTTAHYGTGGLHQVYMGVGWNPFGKLDIGANVNYLWGEYSHSITTAMYEGGAQTGVNSLNAQWMANLRTYKIDLGAQYAIRLNEADWLTVGATASLGHSLRDKVSLLRYTPNDTTRRELKHAFSIPYTVSAGLAYRHKGAVTVAADYTQERWGGCKVPMAQATSDDILLTASTSQYHTRHRINAGAEYVKDLYTPRKYGDLIRYRIGASYATPQVKVNGQDGPTEIHVTAGVALPLKVGSKSLVNVGAEWLNRAASGPGMIKENYVLLNIGVTFNERWFQKWKIN